jgi:hypothetical protein
VGAAAATALAPNAIKAILQYTATPLDARAGSPDALTQGAGAINAPAAIAAARAIDASTALGDDWFDGMLVPRFTVFDGETWAWNSSIMWRDAPVSGDTLLELNRSAWTSLVDWGQPIEWDADVLRLPSIVWDSASSWASNLVWGIDLVGTTKDQTFTWGEVEDPARTVWGDLATKPTGGQTFCWGDIDTSSTITPSSR